MKLSPWVVIPAFNEEKALGDVLADLRRYFDCIVVVDDGSTDDTRGLALSSGAFVCRHPVNLGQGAALQTGFDFVLSRGAEIIVTFDADGQHHADDAARMCDELVSEGLDIVLGSRFLGSTEGMPASRGFLLKCAAAYTRFSTGLSVTDTHNGIRAMTGETARKLRLRQNRMAHASEILQVVAASRMRFRESPVTVSYTDYSKAKGQRALAALAVLADMHIRKLYR